METETVKELSDTLDNCVISVGGGLVLRAVSYTHLDVYKRQFLMYTRYLNRELRMLMR